MHELKMMELFDDGHRVQILNERVHSNDKALMIEKKERKISSGLSRGVVTWLAVMSQFGWDVIEVLCYLIICIKIKKNGI
jgi:hypothetical protein